MEREKEAVLLAGSLHIPSTTLLSFRIGNTVDKIKRHYVEFAGFTLSNAFPNNVVELLTGEIVYVQKFVNHAPTDTLFLVGRQFEEVSNGGSRHEIFLF
jgi:hypothetical protein